MLSEGRTGAAVADINKDGLRMFWVPLKAYEICNLSSKPTLGKFERTAEPSLDNDSIYEDVVRALQI